MGWVGIKMVQVARFVRLVVNVTDQPISQRHKKFRPISSVPKWYKHNSCLNCTETIMD